ncbi:membrane protein [Mycoplasmopsis californica]|uniref:Membrane protein n=1 Tax=Mycoplasmopsis californica TaxID=2113 RepID=A0A059XQD6_9BACT|nr:hypothetical protein [Mycoplasmopsis californica]AIA29235.1 membrane protein [Mycoplasmopsis californica]
MKQKNVIKNYSTPNWVLSFFGCIILTTTLCFIILNATAFYNPDQNFYSGLPTIGAVFKQWTSIFYFTYLTNIFLGVMLILIGWKRQSTVIKRLFFLSITLITVTFLVYWALISYKKSTWETAYSAIKSLITHEIHPIIGFVFLILLRKEIVLGRKNVYLAIGSVLVYILFAFVLYWATYNVFIQNDGATIYTFLNFAHPLFYKGANIGVIIVLNALIIILAISLPIGLTLFWKAVLKIKFDTSNSKCKKQD